MPLRAAWDPYGVLWFSMRLGELLAALKREGGRTRITARKTRVLQFLTDTLEAILRGGGEGALVSSLDGALLVPVWCANAREPWVAVKRKRTILPVDLYPFLRDASTVRAPPYRIIH